MRSSYIQSNIDKIFRNIIIYDTPTKLVELGVLDGYSSIIIGKLLKENFEKKNVIGHLDSYDLFEDYPFIHGDKDEVQIRIDSYGLTDYITLIKDDAYNAYKNYKDNSVNFLHVDISNTGDTVSRIMSQWYTKITLFGVIIFEGGSEERDNVSWMIKYNKPKIKEELKNNELINKYYFSKTFDNYPSFTVLIKTEE